MTTNIDRLTLFAFALVVLIAGTNFVAVKFSNQELSPFWGASLRFFAASFILSLFIIIRRVPIPKSKALVGALLYGIVGFGTSYALLYWALLSVPAGIAAITIALVPLITFFLAIVQKLEHFRFRVLLGALVAALGIALIFYEQLNLDVSLLPFLALVAGAISIAETGIIVKLFPKTHPVSMNAFGMFVGAVLLFLLSQVTSEVKTLPTQPETWIAFIYLVTLGSVVFFALVIFVLKHWTASAVSYQLVLAPIVTIAIAAVLRGETVSLISLVGSLIVLSGVYIGVLTTSKK